MVHERKAMYLQSKTLAVLFTARLNIFQNPPKPCFVKLPVIPNMSVTKLTTRYSDILILAPKRDVLNPPNQSSLKAALTLQCHHCFHWFWGYVTFVYHSEYSFPFFLYLGGGFKYEIWAQEPSSTRLIGPR